MNRSATQIDFTPHVIALGNAVDAETAFRALATLPHVVFFDSAMRHEQLGRHSFVAADPFAWLQVPADGSDALAELSQAMEPYTTTTIPGLPPFQGGAAGLLAYDLCHSLEKLPRAMWDEFQIPALAIGLYDVVVAFDHAKQESWIISQGFPEIEETKRRDRAIKRANQFQEILKQQSTNLPEWHSSMETMELAPQHEIADQLTSDFSRDQYLQTVARAIEYIHAGDVFQVNLSQRLLHPANCHPAELYLRLRQRNPAPQAGYLDGGEFQIASASPERFVQVANGLVETRPIKGTRPRRLRPEADLFAGDELSTSEKDRAENIMIVDLMRNDLSRVCRPDSVQVTQLCQLETYARVQHLVSAIRGELEAGCDAVDLLRAAFPGGSITGAPKVRAMEIIAELEPTARGAYCGSLAYLGFDGSMDSSLLIRTVTAKHGWWQIPVGGGIVADSQPQREYEETWHKAAGMLDAINK